MSGGTTVVTPGKRKTPDAPKQPQQKNAVCVGGTGGLSIEIYTGKVCAQLWRCDEPNTSVSSQVVSVAWVESRPGREVAIRVLNKSNKRYGVMIFMDEHRIDYYCLPPDVRKDTGRVRIGPSEDALLMWGNPTLVDAVDPNAPYNIIEKTSHLGS